MEPSLFTTEWIATCFRNFVSESFKNHIPIKWEYTVVQRYMDLLPVLGLFLHYSISDWSCLAHFLTVVKRIFHAGVLVYVLTTLWKGVQTSLSIIHLQFLRGKSCKAKPNLSLQTWQRLLWHKSCYCLSWFVAYFINVNPIPSLILQWKHRSNCKWLLQVHQLLFVSLDIYVGRNALQESEGEDLSLSLSVN